MAAGERRDWTRCAWCWAPLGDTPYVHRGVPHCDERCAGHMLPDGEDVVRCLDGIVNDDQLVIE